jgi:hypothetical protein
MFEEGKAILDFNYGLTEDLLSRPRRAEPESGSHMINGWR